MTRLVVVGSMIGDQMMTVPRLPERGGDVLAGPVRMQAGGAFNIVAAARRLGLPTAVLGRVGTGPVGTMLLHALDDLGAELLLPVAREGDSGTCIGFVEPDGERTFVTSPGVEQRLTSEDFASVAWRDDDAVYVSGYDLVYPVTGRAIAEWLSGFTPRTLLVDPGPLVADLPREVFAAVLASATILSLNERELSLLGEPSPVSRLAVWDRLPHQAIVIARVGAGGAWLHRRDAAPRHIASIPVDAVDSTGAGDAHAGALLAELTRGLPVEEAVARANAAAALAVTTPGSATGPTRQVLETALRLGRMSY